MARAPQLWSHGQQSVQANEVALRRQGVNPSGCASPHTCGKQVGAWRSVHEAPRAELAGVRGAVPNPRVTKACRFGLRRLTLTSGKCNGAQPEPTSSSSPVAMKVNRACQLSKKR